MAHEIVFLLALKPGVDPAAYERWVREVDYPTTRRQPGVLSYVVTRLQTAAEGAQGVPYHYMETIQVEDPVAYQRHVAEGADEKFTAMLTEWANFVGHHAGSVGQTLE